MARSLSRRLAPQPPADEIEQRTIRRAHRAFGTGNRPRNHFVVRLRPTGEASVETIDREVDQGLYQGAADGGERIVAGHKVAPRETVHGGRCRVQLACQRISQSQASRLPLLGLEVGRPAGQLGPQHGQRSFSGWIVQERADLIHEVVSSRAVRQPVLRQTLIAGENLLNDNIGWTAWNAGRAGTAGYLQLAS